MIQFDIRGKAETASDRIAPVVSALKSGQRANPSLRIEEFGDATSGAAARRQIQSDLKQGRDDVAARDAC